MLFDKDGTLSNSEPYLLSLADERIKSSMGLFKEKKYSQQQLQNLRNLLLKAYGVRTAEVNPAGTLAVASREQNLISTATIYCLLGESWPEALSQAKKVFDRSDTNLEKKASLSKSKRRNLLLPGAKEFIQKLYKAGILCALISNDCSSGIQEFLSENSLEKYFCHFWSADHQPTKPSPIAARTLCNQMGLSTDECALIGDAESDLKMAIEANISLVLGYCSGWRKSPLLTNQQFLINHWDDLCVIFPSNISN